MLGRVERADALVLGPGLGRDAGGAGVRPDGRGAGRQLPLLLDADGLNAHAGRLASLARRSAPTVLTPHAGELARLLESDSAAVGAKRLDSARRAAAEARAIVVLKGDDTLVADPSRPRRRQPRRRPGAGDRRHRRRALGRDRGYLAKGMEPFAAACAGVLVHATRRTRTAGARDRRRGRDRLAT